MAKPFTGLFQERRADRLNAWIRAPRSFADNLMRNEAAVRADATEPCSTRAVGEQINGLKGLKRRMHGQAKHDLLRGRVLTTSGRLLPAKTDQLTIPFIRSAEEPLSVAPC
ncbi:hypothetical protein [Azospirillum brasilense]|uniref:hypothetical protein n=1 Tax=Azospirillum brasilense TaxID=192 RepID=UPI0010C0ADB4|nr:hypothetical protein [Azospirillum brasilense]